MGGRWGKAHKVSRRFIAVLSMVAALAAPATARAAQSDELPPSIPVEKASFQPLSTAGERIDGLKIVITQVRYPGVPDRASCRVIVRSINQGTQTVAAHALVRTYDAGKSEMNAWLVPTGALPPGAATERLYSCKTAQFVVLDRGTLGGWPGRCMVGGEERAPCPLTLAVEANLHLSSRD
jgi:hypothetical protein